METGSRKRKILNLPSFSASIFLGFLFISFFVFSPNNVLAQDPQVNISVQASIQKWQATSTPPNPPGGGGGVVIPETSTAKAVFIGRAYPKALITLLRNEAVAATFFAEDSGLFRKEIFGLPGGNQSFGLWAQDSEGRKSVTLGFAISILPNATTKSK